MPTRIRKVRKLRGSRTHGYGQVGQHRHSGKQGGHGAAGLHKHKWSWMLINEPDHYGRDPLQVPNARKTAKLFKWLNIGDLETVATPGKAPAGPVEIDLSALGVQKLLGSGSVTRAFNVKVQSFTEKAKIKLEEAGGKIIS
ncbi:MAG: 50S ribosomal protein L15 [Thaumarchaeota archaeon]|nr:50S ribosomal protein L15 [Nitrososphaerota archaeon]